MDIDIIISYLKDPETAQAIRDTIKISDDSIINTKNQLNSQNINSLEARDEVLNNEGGC